MSIGVATGAVAVVPALVNGLFRLLQKMLLAGEPANLWQRCTANACYTCPMFEACMACIHVGSIADVFLKRLWRKPCFEELAAALVLSTLLLTILYTISRSNTSCTPTVVNCRLAQGNCHFHDAPHDQHECTETAVLHTNTAGLRCLSVSGLRVYLDDSLS